MEQNMPLRKEDLRPNIALRKVISSLNDRSCLIPPADEETSAWERVARRGARAAAHASPALGTALPPAPSDEALIDDEFKHLSPSLANKFRTLLQMSTAPRPTFSSRLAVPSARPNIQQAEQKADAFLHGIPAALPKRLTISNGADEELKTRLAERETRLAEREARLAEREARLAEREARLAEKDAENARLREGLQLLTVAVDRNPASFAQVPPDSDAEGEEEDVVSESEEEERQDQGLFSGLGGPS